MEKWGGHPGQAWETRLLPLILASDAMAPESELEPLDAVRIQKGIFLMEMDGPPTWGQPFEFIAWNWGPFSKDLAAEVDDLIDRELLEYKAVPHRSNPAYKTTRGGESLARTVMEKLSPDEIAYIKSVRQYVTSRSFNRLLREVYAVHPEYAVRSRFES